MREIYTYQHPDWPRLVFSTEPLLPVIAAARQLQGRLMGRLESLGIDLTDHTQLSNLSLEVMKTSAIEGEKLRDDQVRSSVARQLGLAMGGLVPSERHVDGIVEVQLDAVQNANTPLTDERLFGWHAALFPTGHSGLRRIVTGAYRTDRDGPMQVVSGPLGRERVHFEAPAAKTVRREMQKFLRWFNAEQPKLDLVLKAGIAHLWFITIHPFADGNGRLARAISDLLLSRSEGLWQKFYSVSAEIHEHRAAYYAILEKTERGNLDITEWLGWFLERLLAALKASDKTMLSSLTRVKFWNHHADFSFNARQRTVLTKLLAGFDGALTTQKWAKLAKCSHDTALRDIADLLQQNILVKAEAGGRSTHYELSGIAPS